MQESKKKKMQRKESNNSGFTKKKKIATTTKTKQFGSYTGAAGGSGRGGLCRNDIHAGDSYNPVNIIGIPQTLDASHKTSIFSLEINQYLQALTIIICEQDILIATVTVLFIYNYDYTSINSIKKKASICFCLGI